MSTTTRAEPQAHRDMGEPKKVGWADLAWLAWRQHRGTILVIAALVAAIIAGLLWLNARLPPASCTENSHCFETFHHFQRFGPPLLWAAFGLPFYVAAFLAAPLVAREFEQRTNMLAWSQDISGSRWLLSRAALLGLAAAALAAATIPAVTSLLDTMQVNGASDGFNDSWDTIPFEAAAPLAVAYTIAGLGLGIATGATVRRVVPAIGITLAVFVMIRAILQRLRFHLLPPVRRMVSIDSWFSGTGADVPGPRDYIISGRWVDAAGRQVGLPASCFDVPAPITSPALPTERDLVGCLQGAGVTHRLELYQPVDRVDSLRLIETGIFVAVGVVAVLLAVYLVQRRRSLG